MTGTAAAPLRLGAGTSPRTGTLTSVTTPHPFVIAIDGPSGSGKSSTARGVAKRLGLAYLDTGAMYRAAAWLVREAGVATGDSEAVARLVRTTPLTISLDPEHAQVTIGGHDVTAAIREPGVSAMVSTVASQPHVRTALIDQQRRLIAESGEGIVVEGRDITTVVAPHADLRLLLVADPTARVARRAAELGDKVAAGDVTDQVLRRDRDDATVSRFEQAADGVRVIDSTHLGLEEVIDEVCGLARERCA